MSLADDDTAAEMKRLEGRFERTFTNGAGTVFRAVKDVADGQSTVVTYDDVGNVVESHQSQFKVEKRGPVRVFSFFNLHGYRRAEQRAHAARHQFLYLPHRRRHDH